MVNKTTHVTHLTNSTRLHNATKHVAPPVDDVEDPYLISNGVYMFMPLWPNVINFGAQVTGIYEGIPLVPPLYANARSKKNFNTIMRDVTIGVAVLTFFLAPLAVITYGNTLKDIVLLNLDYGILPQFIQLTYTLALVYNIGINFFPVIEII